MVVPWLLRNAWVAGIVGLCLAGLGACGSEPDAAATGAPERAGGSPPNIVLIVADDLGYGDLGWTGGVARTPTLDRLAREGLELRSFHAYPLCSPSRAALLTGRSPLRYGLAWSPLRPWSESGLPETETTLAEVLREAGYRTALIGKWHLGHHQAGHHPQRHGFDHFYGFLTGAVDYYSKESRDGGVDWQRNGVTVHDEAYATELLTREAVNWIHESAPDTPLFLLLSYSAPHRPMQAPTEALERRADLADPAQRTYAAMVEEMDRGIAEVLSALADCGKSENTLLLFVSDNGGALNLGADNGDFRGGKSTVFQGGLRVPAVVYGPGLVPTGKWSNFASVLDLAPTLARFAGSRLSAGTLDGRDLSAAWRSGQDQALWDAPETPFVAHNGERGQMALFSGKWKFVRRFARDEADQAREQLFDLGADPLEQSNLLQEHPEVAKQLRTRLAEWLALDPTQPSLDQLPAWDGDAPPNWKAPAEWARALR